jgi:hypothetical protein
MHLQKESGDLQHATKNSTDTLGFSRETCRAGHDNEDQEDGGIVSRAIFSTQRKTRLILWASPGKPAARLTITRIRKTAGLSGHD